MVNTAAWDIAEVDTEARAALAGELSIPPILAHLLVQRGYTDPESAKSFLNPTIEGLSCPMSLTGMTEAVGRITRAREQGERILIFGDYDVDGITGSALLSSALTAFGCKDVEADLPVRLETGYGIDPVHVRQAHANGISVIITVDNGISAHAAAACARELGVDLIITDHHTPPAVLPPAMAVVNPKQDGKDHPAYEIAGCAVAGKLAQALLGSMPALDLVALGTIADIVPLRGENRAFAAAGLERMRTHPRLGIDHLLRKTRIKPANLTASDVAFQLAPRINAGGRLGDPTRGLRLLLETVPQQAHALARSLEEANLDRRKIESIMLEEAIQRIGEALPPERRGIVLGRKGWHTGVLGIVAARLQRRYYRPVVLIGFDGAGIGRGSARGIAECNLVAALDACSDLLEEYGGHHQAAGLTIKQDNLDAFSLRFEEAVQAQLGTAPLVPRLSIDALVTLRQIEPELKAGLDRLEPTGHANRSPIFCTMNAAVVPDSVRVLKESHLKLVLRDEQTAIGAIGFGMAEHAEAVARAGAVDAVFSIEWDTFRGGQSLQLMLKDIRPA